jgi:putative acetyltransferase
MDVDVNVRQIQIQDNEELANIIRVVLEEFGGKRPGTAYYDYETDHMFEAYQNDRERYFVAVLNGKVAGGCGIKRLKGGDMETCEIQKLYILSHTRGLGIGKLLVEKCLEFAKSASYKTCYLETFPNMHVAISLYLKYGFIRLKAPLGDTGHGGCDIWMAKKI